MLSVDFYEFKKNISAINDTRTYTTEPIDEDRNGTYYFNETTIAPEDYGFSTPEYWSAGSGGGTVFVDNYLNSQEECLLRGNAFATSDL